MKYLDLSLPTPAENLACDEALLDRCEQEGGAGILRVWEPRQHFVVLGYANKARLEVNLDACRARGVPVLRRCSGGGTVLQGPGCLNYSLVLKIDEAGELQSISETNGFIMKRNAEAMASLLGGPVAVEGFTDLAMSGLKFSGNAQRRKRDWILFHGAFLLDFEIGLMEELLLPPSKQPTYRRNRSHTEFLTRLKVPAQLIKAALQKAWNAGQPFLDVPRQMITQLARDKYSTDAWSFRW